MSLKDRLKSVLRGAPLPLPRKGSGLMTMLTPQPEIDLQPIKTRQQKLEAFVGWVYAATDVIKIDVGQAAWHLVTRRGERPEDTEHLPPEMIPGHFKMPNAFASFKDVIELTTLHLDLVGEAFWHLITAGPESDEVIGFEVVYPHWISDPVVQDGRLVGWRISIPGATGQRTIPARDMIFFRYPHPKEPLCGASPVEAIALSHELDQQARAYGSGLLKNNAVPPILITTEQELDDTDHDIIAERWKDRHLLRPGEPGILGKGATAQVLGLTLKEIGLEVISKMTRQQVFASYGVPESKKGLVEDVNRANGDANERTYQRNVVKPRLFKLAWSINMFLIPRIPALKGAEFEFENPVQEDLEFQLEKVDKMMSRGMITINQGLSMLGEDEQDNGDVFLIPSNVERVTAALLDVPPATESLIRPGERWTHIMEPVEFELAELRFLKRQENIERRMIGKVRVLFSKQQKKVVKAFEENAQALLGPQKDWARVTIDPQEGDPLSLHLKDVQTKAGKIARIREYSLPIVTRDAIDSAIDEDRADWVAEFAAAYLIAIQAGWSLVAESLDVAVDFDVIRIEAAKFARQAAVEKVALISTETKAVSQRIIALGIEDKRSAEVIAGQLRKAFDTMKGARAATIARTETAAALNHGMLETARATRDRKGQDLDKIWVTILDGSCRDDHCNAHGQRRRLDEHFSIGGNAMMRPHDSSAPANQVINCRCSLIFKKLK